MTTLADDELARFDPAFDAPRDEDRDLLGWPPPAEIERLRQAHAETVRALWA